MQSLSQQFAHPRGVLGGVVGMIMAQKNRERNRWTLELLDLQPTDRVLEIGFGPGWAIQQAAQVVVKGQVTGLDVSETMLKQASQRNAAAIREGRVCLRLGSERHLLFSDNTFDKAFAVNSMQFWTEPLRGLKELKRILRRPDPASGKPGGRLAIALQPMDAKSDEQVMQVGHKLIAQLTEAGFTQVRLATKHLKPLCICGIGTA